MLDIYVHINVVPYCHCFVALSALFLLLQELRNLFTKVTTIAELEV